MVAACSSESSCALKKAGPPRAVGARVAEAALRQGLLVLPAGRQGEVVEIAPPAVTSDAQVDFGITCLVETIREALQESGL